MNTLQNQIQKNQIQKNQTMARYHPSPLRLPYRFNVLQTLVKNNYVVAMLELFEPPINCTESFGEPVVCGEEYGTFKGQPSWSISRQNTVIIIDIVNTINKDIQLVEIPSIDRWINVTIRI